MLVKNCSSHLRQNKKFQKFEEICELKISLIVSVHRLIRWRMTWLMEMLNGMIGTLFGWRFIFLMHFWSKIRVCRFEEIPKFLGYTTTPVKTKEIDHLSVENTDIWTKIADFRSKMSYFWTKMVFILLKEVVVFVQNVRLLA